MKKLLILVLLPLTAAFMAAVHADGQTVYKWTDSDGTVHYSDKPPAAQPADLSTLDLPALPPQDPAKIAADQAAQAASTADTLKLLQAQLALQQQQLSLQLQQAQLQAAATPPPAESDTADMDSADEVLPVVYPIYERSAFVPHAYRQNLYLHHRREHPDRGTPVMRLNTGHLALGHPVAALPAHP